jgi:hypothetical protein
MWSQNFPVLANLPVQVLGDGSAQDGREIPRQIPSDKRLYLATSVARLARENRT